MFRDLFTHMASLNLNAQVNNAKRIRTQAEAGVNESCRVIPGIGLIPVCAKFDSYAALLALLPAGLIQFGPRGTIFRNA